MSIEAGVALDVRGLTVRLPSESGLRTIVEGVDFSVQPSEIFGIAGESGSGKTMSMLALLGLAPAGAEVSGTAVLGADELIGMMPRELQRVRGKRIGMVFQDPTTALHPMLRVGLQMTEHMRYHLGISRSEANDRAAQLLDEVRIPNPRRTLRSYPHQFSGGTQQRIAIAMALACEPELLIADEPTTGLDVTVQAALLNLLHRLGQERHLAVILITHDLGVLSSVADRVAIFYAGRVVEEGRRAVVLGGPRHPYTAGLLGALPHPEAKDESALVPIPGSPPLSAHEQPGCAFAPRCSHAIETCRLAVPPLKPRADGRSLACYVDPYVR